MCKLQRDITPQFARESICQMPGKEMPRNSGIKTGRRSVRFSSGSQHHGPNLHSEANLREILGVWQRSLCMLVDLEKAYDRVPRDKLWKVLQEYGVEGQLLRAVKSFYCRPEVCVWVNGKQSKPLHVSVGLRQGCVLSPILFIVYMNWIDKYSQANECATIGNCKITRLLFADDLVLLSSTESGLQRALNSFADACNTAGMKISTAKTEVLHLSRNPDQCVLQVNGATLKQVENFKYLGVAFTSDGRQDEELDTRIGKVSAVM